MPRTATEKELLKGRKTIIVVRDRWRTDSISIWSVGERLGPPGTLSSLRKAQ